MVSYTSLAGADGTYQPLVTRCSRSCVTPSFEANGFGGSPSAGAGPAP